MLKKDDDAVRFAELYRFAVEVRPRGRPEPEPRKKATYLPHVGGLRPAKATYLPMRSCAVELYRSKRKDFCSARYARDFADNICYIRVALL